MRSAEILRRALEKIQGMNGEMIVAEMRQGGLTKRKILSWQKRLRDAADELEKLL